MAFDRKLLHEHEELVLDLRPHWWYMAKATLTLLLVAILGMWLVGWVDGWDWVKYFAVFLIVGSLAWFGARYAKWVTTSW